MESNQNSLTNINISLAARILNSCPGCMWFESPLTIFSNLNHSCWVFVSVVPFLSQQNGKQSAHLTDEELSTCAWH